MNDSLAWLGTYPNLCLLDAGRTTGNPEDTSNRGLALFIGSTGAVRLRTAFFKFLITNSWLK